MRELRYLVTTEKGTTFSTFDYETAHEKGNFIEKVYVREIDPERESRKECFKRKQKIKKRKGMI